jgi:hypothetical protein
MLTKDVFDLATLIVIGTIVLAVVANKNSSGLIATIGKTFNNSLNSMKST